MSRSHSLARAEIPFVIEKGRIIHTPLFTARILTEGVKSIKTAFVASKKVFPKAVLRNKAKRRSRDAFRQALPYLKIAYYVFFLKKDILTANFKELKNTFLKF